jgi:hypothetical protein
MARAKITLPVVCVAQQKYQDDKVTILKIDDDDTNNMLRVHVRLGNNESFKYWITVQSGEGYSENWTNQQVSDAIIAFFGALVP